MKNNEELQMDVQDAIKWEPLLNAAEIGVIAKDGAITLSGMVDNYAKKLQAEDAAKNVFGVKAVVEKIEIKFDNNGKKEDSELANEIINTFKWHWEIPSNKLKVKVEDGWVTIEGELHWNYQREAVRNSVNKLVGVKGLDNKITIKSDKIDEIKKNYIEKALLRSWSISNSDIKVKVTGNNVILNGSVHSLYQKDEAGRISWNAPGVWAVDNELKIEEN